MRSLQTGFALARDVAKGPTLIHALVGASIASMMIDRVLDMVQQPGSPNVYWALSTLPRPLVDFRTAFDAETYSLYLEFPDLQDLDKKQLPSEQWRQMLLKLIDMLHQSTFNPQADDEPLMIALSLQGYPQAKRYLVKHGRSTAEVEAMPVAQVVLLYTLHRYDELKDDEFKWLFMPYAEGSKGIEESGRRLKEAVAAESEVIPIATNLLPAVSLVKQSETRVNWRVAQVRVLEALRLYAAVHGRLPDRLSEISEVPVPVNPFDGKPFAYRRDGETAVLGCEEDGPRGLPWNCEITLARKEK